MRQSINFLKSFPKNYSRLSITVMGFVLLGALGVLILISFLVGLSHHQASKSLTDVYQHLKTEQQNFIKMATEYPLLAGDMPFVERVRNLDQEYQAKKNELDSLQHLINRRGFSKYLRDLTQKTPNTLWLNQIQIFNDSNSITINGYSTSPDAVSDFMNNLSQTEAFKNFVFSLFFVKNIEHHPYLKFSIATKALGSQVEPTIEETPASAKKAKE